MCSVIGQRSGDEVHILDELALPDSNTEAACQAFCERIGPWRYGSPYPIQIFIYGDATGSGRRSAASRTDWQIVENFFAHYHCIFTRRVPSANPPIKDRINWVNGMLRNQAGDRRLAIDPRCKQLILDLGRVHWQADGSGNMLTNIDKSDPMRSHTSDALGYMIAYEFGMRTKAGEMPWFVQ
jgi:hypothetical protein